MKSERPPGFLIGKRGLTMVFKPMSELDLPAYPTGTSVAFPVKNHNSDNYSWVAADPIDYIPPRYLEHPDMFEAAQEESLGPTYLYLPSKHKWIRIHVEKHPEIESAIYKGWFHHRRFNDE